MLENIEKTKVAYLIGFLTGDGNFCDGKGERKDRMSVTSTDEEVVDWINDNIESFSKDNPKFNNNVKRGIIAKLPSYVKTFGVKYTEDFRNYGILCKKTERVYQNIKKSNMKYFLLGFLDADGCFSFTRRKDRDRITGKFMFTHPSSKLLSKIQNFLYDELSIPSTIAPKKGEKCLTLTFSKVDDLLKFGDYLYSDETCVVLTRKLNKYKEFKSLVKDYKDAGKMYPKEFMRTPEYISIIASKGKFMYSDGEREYHSMSLASKVTGISKSLFRQRCCKNIKGFYKREKTEQEKKEFDKYMHKEIRKAYQKWEDDRE